MAERGAAPVVPHWRLEAQRRVASLFAPLVPDDYLELINPLWSTQELRGRIERVELETATAATVFIRPGWAWPGHEPGQYLRIGVVVDGVHHWRAYSLTSDAGRSGDLISVTPKLVEGGKVSPYLVRKAQPGTIVRLGGVEGTFVLPDAPLPSKFLFVSAGSGITPIMSMLRHLQAKNALHDVVLLHSARGTHDVVFGAELRAMDRAHVGFHLHEHLTDERARMMPVDLEQLCPDWREREAFVSGPTGLLDGMQLYWEEQGDRRRLHTERFQPIVGDERAERGEGGTISFTASGVTATCDGSTPILVAGEQAGAVLPYGCRMGICHTCVGRLASGQIRDLRTGKVGGQRGEMIRTCVHAPEGPVEITL